MNKELVYRLGIKSDLENLIEFNYRMALETEDKELGRNCLQRGVLNMLNDTNKGFYLVAEHNIDGVIASLMITKEWSDWRDGYFWWVQSVYVKENYRRRGIYRSLYQNVKSIAQKK